MQTRIERDALGEVEVPAGALYGAQTQRAVENFPISGQRMPEIFLRSLALVKRACALTLVDLEAIEADRGAAIAQAAQEVIEGEHADQFPVDIYQTGSGTSTNMNLNEVLAARATEILGTPVHPNDDVNRGQSSNDVIPTALHLSAARALHDELEPALQRLHRELMERARELDDVLKSGRTHLMDATPIRLGQELSGHAHQVQRAVDRARAAREALMELALGGTAVGTGINRPAGLPEGAIAQLAEATGLPFRRADNAFEAQGARDAAVEAHGQLATIATSLTKIANDLRLLASGPRTGIAELELPAIQPGSSIMPGKVNPVLCEMLVMVAARVAGNQTTMTLCGMGGQLQLNAMMPLMAHGLLQSIRLLARGSDRFAAGCVAGLRARRAACEGSLERNLSLATALAPRLGYDRASKLAKEALRSDRTVREVARERTDIPEEELDQLLQPDAMTRSEEI